MGRFATKGAKFIYEDCGCEETVLDLDDFFFNKGRVPFHSDLTEVTVPNLIVGNMDMHAELCEGDSIQECLIIYYTMLDVLFIREHVRSKSPKTVVELGCNSNVMSRHISSILKWLHPESSYTKNMSAGGLRNNADIVLINASDRIDDSVDIMKLCTKITKENGCVIMLDNGNSELFTDYCRNYPDYHIYTLDDGVKLLINKGY